MENIKDFKINDKFLFNFCKEFAKNIINNNICFKQNELNYDFFLNNMEKKFKKFCTYNELDSNYGIEYIKNYCNKYYKLYNTVYNEYKNKDLNLQIVSEIDNSIEDHFKMYERIEKILNIKKMIYGKYKI